MKYPLLAALLLLSCRNAIAQSADQSYLNRKTLSAGFTMIGLGANGLNTALRAAGYPVLQSSVGVASLSVSTDFGPHWGAFYATDFSTVHGDNGGAKYTRFQYNRFYGGVEYSAYHNDRFELLGRMAISYSIAAVRLYDSSTDTSSFTRYLTGAPDAKRFTVGSFGLDAGFQTRIRITNALFGGVTGGYILNTGSNDWKHDAGSLDGAPKTDLGSWYIGLRIGVMFYRRIRSVSPAEFEGGEKTGMPPARIMTGAM